MRRSLEFTLEPAVPRGVSFQDPATHGTEAGKYVREAVRAHPELYFAKFVVLGEGDTEQLVIPRIAQAQGVDLDPSFVAVVPLGRRHTNHMWKLLNDLSIPHATPLDLDYGRAGAGPARLRDACNRLLANDIDPLDGLSDYDDVDDIGDDLNLTDLWPIIKHLRRFGIFYAKPLDLDYIMLARFSAAYTKLEPGETGPRTAEAARLEADEQVAEGMRRRADEFPGSSASPSPS